MNFFANILKYSSYCIKENVGNVIVVKHNTNLIVGNDAELDTLVSSMYGLPSVIYSKQMMFNKQTKEYRDYNRNVDRKFWIKYYIGDIKYYQYSKYGRDGGDPSIVRKNGSIAWWKYGKLHRNNGYPAKCYNGNSEWWINGELHRDNDLPAKFFSNGDEEWWQHGKLHRDNDLPAKFFANGDQEWWQHGELNRENDLPARFRPNNVVEWWQHGKLHREGNLCSVFYASGSKKWYTNGKMGSSQYKKDEEWWKYGSDDFYRYVALLKSKKKLF